MSFHGEMKNIARAAALLFLALTAGDVALAQPAYSGVYHEASCPSVDTKRMTRMKRVTAEATGLLPALDCHPDARVRYLGTLPTTGAPALSDDGKTIHVREYYKKDGTHVDEHWRKSPQHQEAPETRIDTSQRH